MAASWRTLLSRAKGPFEDPLEMSGVRTPEDDPGFFVLGRRGVTVWALSLMDLFAY
jgi:hypothetical protein